MSGTNHRAVVMLPLLACALTLAACSSQPSRGVEKANCAVVGQLLGAPPADQAAFTSKVIQAGSSGDRDLDVAMQQLATSLKSGASSVVADQAFSKVQAVCSDLGLWKTFH